MDANKLLDQVKDTESFLVFVRALAADRAESSAQETASSSSPYGADANGWENTTIESFLESAVAWAEASNFGLAQGLSPSNPWKQFAIFLYCGKTYE